MMNSVTGVAVKGARQATELMTGTAGELGAKMAGTAGELAVRIRRGSLGADGEGTQHMELPFGSELLSPEEQAQGWRGSFDQLLEALGGMVAIETLRTDGGSASIEDERAKFVLGVAQLRYRMKHMFSWLLNPRGALVGYWDLVITMALMFTISVTPYEVSLDVSKNLDTLFWINQVVGIIFLVDIVCQFFLPTQNGDGQWIKDHAKLATAYLRGWFVLDLVSVLPFDVVIASGALVVDERDRKLVRLMRLVRVLRLLKLVRILRASR